MPTPTMTLHGASCHNEISADNRDIFEAVLRGESSICTPEYAKQRLDLSQKFPPGIPHDRLIAHEVTIYRIGNPRRVIRAHSEFITGDLEQILTIDLGEELMRHSTGDPLFREEV